MLNYKVLITVTAVMYEKNEFQNLKICRKHSLKVNTQFYNNHFRIFATMH